MEPALAFGRGDILRASLLLHRSLKKPCPIKATQKRSCLDGNFSKVWASHLFYSARLLFGDHPFYLLPPVPSRHSRRASPSQTSASSHTIQQNLRWQAFLLWSPQAQTNIRPRSTPSRLTRSFSNGASPFASQSTISQAYRSSCPPLLKLHRSILLKKSRCAQGLGSMRRRDSLVARYRLSPNDLSKNSRIGSEQFQGLRLRSLRSMESKRSAVLRSLCN